MDAIFSEIETKMKKAVDHYIKEIGQIRTGRASTAVLDGIKVVYYGQESPLNQVASISIIEAKTIDIKPWDRGVVSDIEKALTVANLGLGISNTGDSIKLRFPDMTEENRKEIVKKVKKMAEESKVDIRNIRRDGNEKLKDKEKNKLMSQDELKAAEGKVQKLTDKFIKDLDDIAKDKETDLMKI